MFNLFDYILFYRVCVWVLGFFLVVFFFGIFFLIVGDNRSLNDVYKDSNKVNNGLNLFYVNENFK